jgi:hypothetical protein
MTISGRTKRTLLATPLDHAEHVLPRSFVMLRQSGVPF